MSIERQLLPITPVSREVLRTSNPTSKVGTVSDGRRLEPAPGRYQVLSAEGREFLYVPEQQALFAIDESLAAAMREGIERNDDDLRRATRALAARLAQTGTPAPLHEGRHSGNSLRDVVIHVSQVCNLACVYCYANDLNAVNKLMTEETASLVVNHTLGLATRDTPGQGLSSVKFLGGEPTIAWSVIEFLMAEYTIRSESKGVGPPRFTMVTNGIRMTPEMIKTAAAFDMYVLVSLDGPPLIHDTLRPSKQGKGSYAAACETLRRLVEAGVNIAVESVYTRQHLDSGLTPQDLIDHFLGLGVREFQIQPTVGVWHDSDTIEQADAVTQWFSEAVAGSVRSFRSADPYLLRGIQFVLDGFSLRERRRHVCGAGRTFMGVNYDGQAFPCYLLESPDLSYGFIGGDWDQSKYEDIKDLFVRNGKEYHPVCRECWANEICQSCLGTSFQIDPKVSKPPSWFCKFQKALISTTLTEIALARESPDWALFIENLERYLRPINLRA